jgi:hypothetical protein
MGPMYSEAPQGSSTRENRRSNGSNGDGQSHQPNLHRSIPLSIYPGYHCLVLDSGFTLVPPYGLRAQETRKPT